MICANRELRIAGNATEMQSCKWTPKGKGKSECLVSKTYAYVIKLGMCMHFE